MVATSKLHWMLFSGPATLALLALFLSSEPDFAATLWAIVAVWTLLKAITYGTSEIGLTDRRVLAKVGLIRRSTMELMLNKVESIQVRQGITGRLLGYGHLVIIGTGGTRSVIKNMPSPEAFAQKVRAVLPT